MIRRWAVACIGMGLAAWGGMAADAPVLEGLGEEAFQAVKAFYDYDPSIPLEGRIVREWDYETTVKQKIVFRGVHGYWVPGYFERPKDAEAPYPLVLLLHGWSGSKEAWYQDGNIISGGDMRKALLSAGYAILALDAATHGERSGEIGYLHVNPFDDPQHGAKRSPFTLPEIYIQTTKDYRRALDYLAERGDVDMDRIGLIGYSMGGTQSFLVTAVEPRITCTVACVVPAMRERFLPVAPKNFARGIVGRPFLMLMGRQDTMYTESDTEQLYALIESPHSKLIWYDQGHKLTEIYVPDALAWIEGHL